MRYLLLIYNNRASTTDPAQLEQLIHDHAELHRELATAGTLLSSASLGEPRQTTTVQVRDGTAVVTDGPYLETKEYLAGYYLVDCETPEHAAQIAARIPCSVDSAVEIRPVDEDVTQAVAGEA